MTSRKLSTFRIGGDLFGVPVEDVQEVTRSHEVTPVPLAPEAVTGLMNLRGQVVTVVDLRVRLGYPPREAGAPTANVVVRTSGSAGAAGGIVSLLVDRVEGFADVTDEQFAERPDTVTGPAGELVTGAYELPGRLLLALDLHRAVDVRAAA
ncbi:MAG: chemotaxis protein CheW [Frankiaceae bacterium]